MTTTYPLGVRLAEAIGLFGAVWLSGMIFTPAPDQTKTKAIGPDSSPVDQYLQSSISVLNSYHWSNCQY